MIHGHHVTLPSESSLNFGIPLLDDEFDTGVEEIFDHNDLFTLPTHTEEEEIII